MYSHATLALVHCLILVLSILSADSHAMPTAEAEHEDPITINLQLTLREVLEKTFARSPQQSVLQAMDGEVQARYIQASGVMPAVPAVSIRHQNDAIGSSRGEREWEAEVELSVWLPGQRDARKIVASDTQAGLAAGREGLMLQIAGVLRDAVWDINMNKENVVLFEARYKAAQQLEDDVNHRYKAGELAKTDLMLMQNETLQSEMLLLKANAELKHAKHRYIVLTGFNEMPENVAESLSNLKELSDQHPLIKEVESKIELAKGERNLVATERRDNPQLTLSARSQRGAFDNAYNDSVGIKVRIPFDGEVRNAPLLAAAESNIAKNVADRDRLKLTMQTMFHEAEHSLSVTNAEIKLVSKQHQITQESLILAKKAFSLGETDLVSLMRAQALAYEAERAVASKKIQLQWDIARYNQAVGVLP